MKEAFIVDPKLLQKQLRILANVRDNLNRYPEPIRICGPDITNTRTLKALDGIENFLTELLCEFDDGQTEVSIKFQKTWDA